MGIDKTINYIALLRGINVGGHNVKMEYLRKLFRELGFDDVRSYIQTGNMFFKSKTKEKEVLRSRIEAYLSEKLGYKIAVCLRTYEELEQIFFLDPFNGIDVTEDIRLAVTFLSVKSHNQFKIPYLTKDGAYEVIRATDYELFSIWHLQNGRPGNSYGYIERMLGVDTTTRFWHTAKKILEASKKD